MPERRVTFGCNDELIHLHQGTMFHNLQSFTTVMTGVNQSWSDIHSTGNTLKEKHSLSSYGKGKQKVIHELYTFRNQNWHRGGNYTGKVAQHIKKNKFRQLPSNLHAAHILPGRIFFCEGITCNPCGGWKRGLAEMPPPVEGITRIQGFHGDIV